ncbi:MAG: hypothetical protein LBB49_04170 [Gracilibacteraceae bacterium]|nr:hypothetical protein [Gracilibacteraceae bacterium]
MSIDKADILQPVNQLSMDIFNGQLTMDNGQWGNGQWGNGESESVRNSTVISTDISKEESSARS